MIHVHAVVGKNIKNVVVRHNCSSIEKYLGEILGAFLILKIRGKEHTKIE